MNQLHRIKISILVPVYGVEKYIKKCAESLFSQDYPNIEFIFVNDCTLDKSIEVLHEVLSRYPHRTDQVKIITHDFNRGLSTARNTALDHSTGEYLLPIDSDDYLSSPYAVTTLVELALKNNADVVFYDMQLIYPNKSFIYHTHMPTNYKELTQKLISRELSLTLWGGLYKRELFTKYDIRSIPEISMGEDYVVKTRLAYYMRKIIYCNEPFYCYNQINSEAITKHFKSSWINDFDHCMQIIQKFFHSKDDCTLFKSSIELGNIREILHLLSFCILYKGNKTDIEKIQNLLKKNDTLIKRLSINEIIIYYFAKFNFLKLLKLYLFLGIKTKHFIRPFLRTHSNTIC